MYINDIVEAAGADVQVVMFADDAAFFISAAALLLLYEQITKLFRVLSRYLLANKLIATLSKSKLMLFTSRPHGIPEDIMFGNDIIEWVK